MTDPTPLAQKLLEQARSGHEPSTDDEARVRAALHARLLANPLLLGAKGTHALANAGKVTWAKLSIALGLGGAAVVGALVVAHGLGSREAPLGARQATAAASAALPTVGSALPPLPPAPPSATTNEQAPPSNGTTASVTQRHAPTTPSSSPSAGSADLSAQDIQREIAGLSRAQQLLHSGRAGEALSALARLTEQVPRGALMEERDATLALAQCAVAPSSSAAAAFVARYPKSVHAARVRSACTDAN